MRSFKDTISNSHTSDCNTDVVSEGLITGLAMERRLKGLSANVSSAPDIGRKLDIIAKMIHIGIGAVLLGIHRKR